MALVDNSVNMEPAHLSGEAPTELPHLYKLIAFVPWSLSRRDGRSAPVDDWEWTRVEYAELLELEAVPEALVFWNRRFSKEYYHGKPHFRLVEVTGEGNPVTPAPGMTFLDEEDADCLEAEEVAHHPV